MGLVPKTTKSEVKFFGGLTMPKIMGLFVSAGLGVVLGNSFSGLGQLALSGIFIAIFFIATAKAPTNPKITFIVGMAAFFTFLLRKKKLYGPSSDEYKEFREKINAKEEKRNARKRKKGKAEETAEESDNK